MTRLVTNMLVLAAVLACGGGCARHVMVDYDKSINFASYHRYAIQAKAAESSKDPRLDSHLIDKRITLALERELAGKGFALSQDGHDFQVSYQLNLNQEIAADQNGVSMVFGTGGRRSSFGLGYHFPSGDVESYEKVLLTIDMMAAETGHLVWRGTGTKRFMSEANPGQLDSFFNGLVRKVLRSFPPTK
ncbi:MAG: DUF4136 domain-containing protein [Thermodesulfobacteriota bacterium]